MKRGLRGKSENHRHRSNFPPNDPRFDTFLVLMVLRDYEIEVKDRQISLEEDRAILTGKSTTTGYHRRDLSRVRVLLALCLRFLVNRRHPSCFQKLGTHVENHDHRDRGQTQRDDRGYHNQGDVQGNWSRLNVCSNIFNVRSIVSYILSSDTIKLIEFWISV